MKLKHLIRALLKIFIVFEDDKANDYKRNFNLRYMK